MARERESPVQRLLWRVLGEKVEGGWMATPVTCVDKRPHKPAHEQIVRIGATNWRITQAEAIRNIEAGQIYEVTINRVTALIVITTHKGRKYIRTSEDRYGANNLLSLPPCRPVGRGAGAGRRPRN
jgi:Protein of unknown function (DUF3892)